MPSFPSRHRETEQAISADPLEHEIALGPLLKVQRARQHINDLDWLVTDYLTKVPFQLRVRQSINPPQRLIYIQAKHSIPEHIALILGDAVHNLRTALDQLCFGMVGDKTARPEGVGFPFCKRGDGLGGAISTRQMHLAPAGVKDVIHELRPYPGGNKYLHAIKVLDERDKHHVILTVGLGVQMSGAQLGSLIGGENIPGLGPNEQIATVGDFIVALDPTLPITSFDNPTDFQPPFTVGFGQGEELVSEPVIPSLLSMTQETEHAITRMMYAFLAGT